VSLHFDPFPATRAFLNTVGLPSTLQIKCDRCGARPSNPGVNIHAVSELIGKERYHHAFLCCGHGRAFTGKPCCSDASRST
jgi:hypothetical protein